MMKLLDIILLMFLTLITVTVYAEGNIRQKKIITLQECIDTAIKQHPGIIASKNTIDASESRINEAYAGYYPQISASAGYDRISSSGTTTGSGYKSSTGTTYNQYTSGLSLNQTIYDFGKTSSQVKIQKLNTDAFRADYDTSMIQVIYNVKVAYYGLLQAQKNMDVSIETVKQMQQHRDQAKGYFDVHMKSKLDVTTAEMNLSNANLVLIQSENAVKIARINLQNAVGLDIMEITDFSIEDNMTFQKEEINFNALLEEALKNRPDYQSQQLKIKSLEKSIDLATTGFFPVLNGSGGYTWKGAGSASDFPQNHEWNLGVSITIPLFSGFLTTNQVKEAQYNLNTAKANADLVKQQVMLDVQQAIIRVKEAEKAIPAAELTVVNATENLELASGRYQAGVGNMIEVTDAQQSYINARMTYINALYNYKIARASLDKATGVK